MSSTKGTKVTHSGINTIKREQLEQFANWYANDYLPNEYPKQCTIYERINDEAENYGFHLFKMNPYINAVKLYKKKFPELFGNVQLLPETSMIAHLRKIDKASSE